MSEYIQSIMDSGYIITSYAACMIFRKNLIFPEKRIASITKSYIDILRHYGFCKLATEAIKLS